MCNLFVYQKTGFLVTRLFKLCNSLQGSVRTIKGDDQFQCTYNLAGFYSTFRSVSNDRFRGLLGGVLIFIQPDEANNDV